MKQRVSLCAAVLAAVLLAAGCELFPDLEAPAETGSLSIAFGEGGGPSGGRAVSEETLSTLRYDLTLTGPDNETIAVSLTAGESFSQEVHLGGWHIEAKAYTPDGALFGAGSTTATIKPGHNPVRIPMTEVETAGEGFVPVTGITGVPTVGTVGIPLTLSGTVTPTNATNQTVAWSVNNAGTTGAFITGTSLSSTGAGTVVVTASIADGLAVGTPYTENFTITINAAFVAVTGITDVPAAGTAGTDLTLIGTVAPSNATNQTIVWSVNNAGTTGASITGDTLSSTGPGTVVVTATIANGTAVGTPYTQDFNITINAASDPTSVTHTVSGVSFTMRLVPAGSFQRDSGTSNISVISAPYWMGETEVTQELWEEIIGGGSYNNPSYFMDNPEDTSSDGWKKLPVENVSWYQAIAFCNKLSLRDGKTPVYSVSSISDWGALDYNTIPTMDDSTWNNVTANWSADGYRLPTEMEWMWAAMGADTENQGQTNTTGYNKAFAGSIGSNVIGDYAWYTTNSSGKTHEVKRKLPNELGLYDMSGNVWEWCWDRYDTYPNGSRIDYRGPASSPDGYRAYRGNSYSDAQIGISIGVRNYHYPYNIDWEVGFRVVCKD
jgi:formylglycine-generating enzyme required for sulfatase activity